MFDSDILFSIKKSIFDDSNTQYVSTGNKTDTTKVKKVEEKIIEPKKEAEVVKSTVSEKKLLYIAVDTLKWTEVSSKNNPIKLKTKKSQYTNQDGLLLKDDYNIVLLIPLGSSMADLPSDSRFLQYYGGLLHGLENLDDLGYKFNIKVIDTEEGYFNAEEFAKKYLDSTDLIIGPFKKEHISILTEKCKEAQVPMVSPWYTSTKVTSENPFYIQMKPNLRAHFKKMVENSVLNHNVGEVAIVYDGSKESQAWVDFFQDHAKKETGKTTFFKIFKVSGAELESNGSSFKNLFTSGVRSVILPNFSYNDEGYIYNALRKLNAEKGGNYISVYGMPIIFDSDKFDFEFFHSLNMKLVVSDFIDHNQDDIRAYKRRFFEAFGEIPTVDAFKGYDLIQYLGNNLWKYGKNFQYHLENENQTNLKSNVSIQKVLVEENTDPTKFDYFENLHLEIIQFNNNRWERIY